MQGTTSAPDIKLQGERQYSTFRGKKYYGDIIQKSNVKKIIGLNKIQGEGQKKEQRKGKNQEMVKQ